MSRIQVVVIIIIKKDGKYLLTKRQEPDPKDPVHGKWQLPGGGLEFAETPEEATIREAREELGVEVQIERLIPKVITKVRGEWQGVFTSFICKISPENQEIVINHEASEFGWFSFPEVQKLDTLAGIDELLIEAEKL